MANLTLESFPHSDDGSAPEIDTSTPDIDTSTPEIDTSAPFESVKEAVSKFGGLGFWKPLHYHKPSDSLLMHDLEEVDVANVEAQAAELEKELVLKEKDTLEVLKELEATKLLIDELKSKLQNEEFTANLADEKPSMVKEGEGEEEKENNPNISLQKLPECSTPGLILMDLKQAKLNLNKTTTNLAEIRASMECYNKKIEKEKISLEKTRERLRSNSLKISSLEKEIYQTRSKQEDDKDFITELKQLNVEAEKFKKLGEAAKSEVTRIMLDIEQTKVKIKTAEIRLVAAKKMKEAARAAEAIALADIKALENSENSCEKITLTLEEYSSLRSKAQNSEENSKLKVLEAMVGVDEANVSKMDIMKRVEEAMEEVKTSKQALEEALNRVESANNAKLAVEDALRKWRSENGEKRRSIQNSTKFKNPYPSHRRRDSWMLDVNGVDMISEASAPLKPTLSIGQILSRKLLITQEFESGKSSVRRKISLGQMLGKENRDFSDVWKLEKDYCEGPKKLSLKRKKFGFARFSVLLTKKNKKKKKGGRSSGLLDFQCS